MSSLAPADKRGNHVAGVDDLDIVRRLDVGGGHQALAVLAQAQRDFIAVVELEHHALEVEQHVDDVFLHAIDGRILMHHPGDGDFGRRMAGHGRQQDPAQGIAQRVAVTALERLERDFGAIGRHLFDVDGLGLEQIVQHSNFLQYPRLVTPIRQTEHGPDAQKA
jgi:hypothetical protein